MNLNFRFPISLLLLLALTCSSATATSFQAPVSTAAAWNDTLQYTFAPGETVIIALPAEAAGELVDSYEIIQAPALSWLRDRSFFWRTPEDGGEGREVLFSRTIESGVRDTLVVHFLPEN